MTTLVDEKPWYRQFWPWFIMALPAAAVAAAITCVVIAFKNQDSVVRDDWYQDGKSINLDLARDTRASALGVNIDLTMDAVTGEIRGVLHGKPGLAAPSKLQLVLSHVTRADLDQIIALPLQSDGEYRGAMTRQPQGRFEVELSGNDWRLTSSQAFPQQVLQLGPH